MGRPSHGGLVVDGEFPNSQGKLIHELIMPKFFGIVDYWFELYTCLTIMSTLATHLTQQAQPLMFAPCYIGIVMDPGWQKDCVLVVVGINPQSLICSWWKSKVYARLQGGLFSLYPP